MELEKIKSEINKVCKELDEMSEQYSIYYKQIEQQLIKEINSLVEKELELETKLIVKMRCLQRYRLDFDIFFSYEDDSVFGTNIECRYYSVEYNGVKPTKSLVKLYINYSCRQVYRNDTCGLDCIKVLGLLANNFDFIENKLWDLINNKDFVALEDKHNMKNKELNDLQLLQREKEKKIIESKIKLGACFQHYDLPFHIYKIVKLTKKYIYYEDLIILNDSLTQSTCRISKILINDFITFVKWKDYYFIENQNV